MGGRRKRALLLAGAAPLAVVALLWRDVARHSGPGRFHSQWTTTANGWRIHARVPAAQAAADAPAVVLVHGLGASGRYMVPTLLRLAPACRVWAPDLPGYGRSTKPERTLTLPELADALAAWMDGVALDRAALLGNSLGCQVIAHFAARHPARLTRAVLTSPTMDPAAPTPLHQTWRLLLDAPREAPSTAVIAVWGYWRAGPRRMWRTLLEALADDPERTLPLVHVPALVVRGDRDPVVSGRWAERVAALLPRGRLVVLPGAPHALNYSAAEALVEVARPFLAGEG